MSTKGSRILWATGSGALFYLFQGVPTLVLVALANLAGRASADPVDVLQFWSGLPWLIAVSCYTVVLVIAALIRPRLAGMQAFVAALIATGAYGLAAGLVQASGSGDFGSALSGSLQMILLTFLNGSAFVGILTPPLLRIGLRVVEGRSRAGGTAQ